MVIISIQKPNKTAIRCNITKIKLPILPPRKKPCLALPCPALPRHAMPSHATLFPEIRNGSWHLGQFYHGFVNIGQTLCHGFDGTEQRGRHQ